MAGEKNPENCISPDPLDPTDPIVSDMTCALKAYNSNVSRHKSMHDSVLCCVNNSLEKLFNISHLITLFDCIYTFLN